MGRPFYETIVKWRELKLISLEYKGLITRSEAVIKCWRWQYQKIMEYYGNDFWCNQNKAITLTEVIKDWSTNEVVVKSHPKIIPDACTLEGQQHETEAKVEIRGSLYRGRVPSYTLRSLPPSPFG